MEPIKWVTVSRPKVPANPAGPLWTVVFETLGGVTKLRIRASGTWSYSKDREAICGPDGDRVSYLPARNAINPKAPIGALIGKIGGGTADVDGTRGFVVGSHYVLEVAEGETLAGSLFLTINDLSSGYGDNSGELNVQVDVCYQPRPGG